MRWGIIGFILGAVSVLIALIILQQRVIRDVTPDLGFRFDRYVFDGTSFPAGDFTNGRMVHRCLFPSRFTTTFYDAGYHEVTQADKPGRYGAVVRMHFGLGYEVVRFITLFRTSTSISWVREPWFMTAILPAKTGLDFTLFAAQQAQIAAVMKNSMVQNGATTPDLAILLAGLSETSPQDPPATDLNDAVARNSEWWYTLRQHIGLPLTYPYSIDLPRDYEADAAKRWPLILYVHSGAERGTDMQKVRASGIPLAIEQGRQIPAVVVSPQCPENQTWDAQALLQLVDDVSAKYRIDSDRIYVTGGGETWMLASLHPERFAAIVPLEGEPAPADAARLKDLPIWAFQGQKDADVGIGGAAQMVNAIHGAGGHSHLTTIDARFDPWDVAYGEISADYSALPVPHDAATFARNADPMYAWMLAQKRGQPEVITPGVPAP
jgi:dienelactone hydrolase